MISVKDPAFGAVGDGVADDTGAIQAAIDAAASETWPPVVYIPAGRYRTTSGLAIIGNKIALRGDGPYQSSIVGDFDAGDIVRVGKSAGSTHNVLLSNLRVDSSVVKSSGAALYLDKVVRSRMENVILAGQDGQGYGGPIVPNYLWDGLVLDRCDWIRWSGGEIRTQNDGIRAWGAGPGSLDPRGSDIMLFDSKVTGGGVGLRCAGDIGGLRVDFMSFNNCEEAGVVIDQTGIASGNRQIFFGPNVDIDGHSIDGVRQQPGIVCDDPLLEDLQLCRTWLSVHTIGIHVKQASAEFTQIHIIGGVNRGCDLDGIKLDAIPRRLMVNGVDFRDISGWGVNSSVNQAYRGGGEGILVGPTNSFRAIGLGAVSVATAPPLPGSSFIAKVPNNGVFAFIPRDQTTIGSSGWIAVTRDTTASRALAFYRAAPGGSAMVPIESAGILTATGLLTGTTGAPGTETISAHTDRKIRIENRSGADRQYCVHMLGAYPGTTVPSVQ